MSANQSNSPDLEALRAKAQEIAQRLRIDPQFVQSVVSDPKSALVSAGLPAEAINDVIGQSASAGQDFCFVSCVTTECCLTVKVCCNTGSC